MPDGGDQVPSAFLAMRIPDPPEPDIQRPDRTHENIAMPTAFCIIRAGTFLVLNLGEGGGGGRVAPDGVMVERGRLESLPGSITRNPSAAGGTERLSEMQRLVHELDTQKRPRKSPRAG